MLTYKRLAVILTLLSPIQAICTLPSTSGWCSNLITACKSQNLQSVLSSKICVGALSCSTQTQNYLTCFNGGTTVQLTGTLPLAATITQQNFIDLIYSALATGQTNLWPDTKEVINLWSEIVMWTNRGANVPLTNFKDYLIYYRPSIVPATTSTLTVPIVQANSTSLKTLQYPQQCSNEMITCPAAPSSHCADLFANCLRTDVAYLPPFSSISCTLSATCFTSVSDFSKALSCALPATLISANPQLYGRLGSSVFSYISQGGSTVSLQNFIDAYYGQLTFISSQNYPDISVVQGIYSRISSWTRYANAIPNGNFADWLNYSNN